MIPKIIHYCWFGGNPLPQSAIKCIKSWKKYCPDYEIKEWNESNFDVSVCDYAREAYEAKKWAFVSDYARFKILYENGGIYFDTDVELLKPLDDLVELGPFMGREDNSNSQCSVAPGLGLAANPGLGLAANPGLGLYKEILDFYEKKHFFRNDGAIDYTTVVTFTTEILEKHGLKNTNEIQNIAGVYIYPKEYFCPKDYETLELNITQNTYSIHHFDSSWHTEEQKYSIELGRKLKKYHLGLASGYISNFIAAVKFRGFKSAVEDLVDWIKRRVVKIYTSF